MYLWLRFDLCLSICLYVETCQITYLSRASLCKLSSHLMSYLQLTLRVTWYRFLQFSNDIISASALIYETELNTWNIRIATTYMQGYANNTSHAVIRSTHAHLLFILVSNNMSWSVITVQGYTVLLWLLD